jgi:uncharacterized protein with PQ loop repeat
MVATILGMGAGAMILTIIIWLLPMFFIVKSNKTSGAEKLFWLLAVLFVSWFAWIFYMLLAPIGDKEQF